MSETLFDLELRPVSMDDAEMMADLETTRRPDDPRDPVMLRHWWAQRSPRQKHIRRVAARDDVALASVSAGHEGWDDPARRFGWIRVALRPELWTESRFHNLVGIAEVWLREEGATTAVARARSNFNTEIALLEGRGYVEARRARGWELDLVAGREQLLATAQRSRDRMKEQGVRLLTLAQDSHPDRLVQLHELEIATERDIPTTVPIRAMPFDEWRDNLFGNPSTREDRFWIAREGDRLVGLSLIQYPPVRGIPWTAFTSTSRAVRGRGIARALKYETVAQAIALGAERVQTFNDSENAPILHINLEMGYQPVDPEIELHRELSS